MSKGLEQQFPAAETVFMKSAPMPKHGRKPDPLPEELKERRSFSPRPGH